MASQTENTPFKITSASSYGVIKIDLDPTLDPGRQRRSLFKRITLPAIAFGLVAVTVSLILVSLLNTTAPETLKAEAQPQTADEALTESPTTASQLELDIQTPQGSLRGYTRKSRKGRDFYAFYKVPYAKPPLGPLRFKDPEPAEPWDGLRDVKKVAPQCIQKSKYSPIDETAGDEDCLYANVYTPAVEGNYPTMVYTHGGALNSGNGSKYGAEYFMDEDVVLVTYQFRLGPLGFINSGDDEMRGNQGFKDQIMVLRWVHDNIASFGGDPSHVTIFGNSGGGIGISLQMLSPLGKGLFHRAISQSGASPCATAFLDLDPKATVTELAKAMNCSEEEGTKSLVTCLQSKSASELALVRIPNTKFGLTLETLSDRNANKFMPDYPFNLLKSGNVNNVPYMLGVVNAEWVGNAVQILQDENLTQQLNSNFSGVAGGVLGVGLDQEELESLKKFYFGDKRIANETLTNLTNLVSDRGLVHCSYLGARMHGDVNDTFLYHITKAPALSYADKDVPGFPAKELGYVAHADELQFQFPYAGYPEIGKGDEEYFHFSEYFVRVWANFAKNGNPRIDGQHWKTASSWKGVDTDDDSFWFELSDNPGETTVLHERMSLWDRFSHAKMGYEL